MTALDLIAPNARNTRGRVPVFLPQLNGEDIDIQVHEMSVSCAEGRHDSVTLRAQSTELEDTDGMVNSPFSFRFGSAPRTEYFYGYVTDVKEEQGSQGALTFTLTLLGTTKVMVEGTPHFWSNKSATSAISDVVNKNRLGWAGHDHTHLWHALAQTQESDWTFVTSLAHTIGFVIFYRYGVVLSYDPVRMFNQFEAYATLSSSGDTSDERNLLMFEPTEYSEVLEQSLGRRYGYFTSHGDVQVIQQSGDYMGYLFDPTILVRDQDEAQVYIEAADRRFDGWKQHAIARIWGDADILPGHVVNVRTTNRRFLRDKYDGKWMVRATEQQADRQQYQTMLYLMRPDTTVASTGSFRPFWVESNRAKPIVTLNEGVWVSSWNDRTVASVL
jgi:hypothetical protein